MRHQPPIPEVSMMPIGTFWPKMLVGSVLLHASARTRTNPTQHFRAFEGVSVLRGGQCRHLHASDRRRPAQTATRCDVRHSDADADAEGVTSKKKSHEHGTDSNQKFNGPQCSPVPLAGSGTNWQRGEANADIRIQATAITHAVTKTVTWASS